jgi:hypothetical protein
VIRLEHVSNELDNETCGALLRSLAETGRAPSLGQVVA